MDANGTRFQLLLGRDDWAHCLDGSSRPLRLDGAPASPPSDEPSLVWDAARNELTLRPLLFRFVAAPADQPPSLSDRRGAGRDRFGNWYWIAPSGLEVLVNSSGTGATSHFWAPGDGEGPRPACGSGAFVPKDPPPTRPPWPLGGLAVTDDHYLVVGVIEPAGLLVFDLDAGGPPRRWLWPGSVPFRPFDMAPAPGGGVWVLDRANARYWGFDRHFRVRDESAAPSPAPTALDLFQPLAPGPARPDPGPTFPPGTALHGSPPSVADPIAIEALGDGSVLILDQPPGEPFCRVQRYSCGRPTGAPASARVVLDSVEPGDQPTFRLVGHDFAFVPAHAGTDGPVGDRLHIVSADGNQAFAFEFTLNGPQVVLSPANAYQPMRLFGGKGLVRAGDLPYYDFADRWIPLVEQRRPRYVEEGLLQTPLKADGAGSRPPFDGREPGCVWHRLMLDACIPPEAEVQVWSRAADDPTDLPLLPWSPEPSPYLRGDGSELPFVRETVSASSGRGTWELLFQAARGRYLQVQLQLSGNGRVTPRIRALRAYYPRFSYLGHYLPATYRDDPASASFLDRFLANLEGFFTAVEDKIDVVQMLFDVRSAPPEALDWLAGWYGVALDPSWDEPRRRLFLAHAMDFFQYRGTVRGLTLALRLALDPCADASIFNPPTAAGQAEPVRIVEGYRRRTTPGVVLGDPTAAGPSVSRASNPSGRWGPAQGGAALNRLYTNRDNPSGSPQRPVVPFPLRTPCDPTEAAGWRQFAQATLGFVPSATGADLGRWQDFLARRYKSVDALNAAYALGSPTKYQAFAGVPLPAALPPDGPALADWYQFESVVLAVRRTAHRFTVLIPAPVTPDPAEHRRRLDLVSRIVALEKPAHAVFDVKFYWAMFRVGEVRLGQDTVLDLGSRSPLFLRPASLGQAALSQSYLSPRPPQDAADRTILGRNRLARDNPPFGEGNSHA